MERWRTFDQPPAQGLRRRHRRLHRDHRRDDARPRKTQALLVGRNWNQVWINCQMGPFSLATFDAPDKKLSKLEIVFKYLIGIDLNFSINFHTICLKKVLKMRAAFQHSHICIINNNMETFFYRTAEKYDGTKWSSLPSLNRAKVILFNKPNLILLNNVRKFVVLKHT